MSQHQDTHFSAKRAQNGDLRGIAPYELRIGPSVFPVAENHEGREWSDTCPSPLASAEMSLFENPALVRRSVGPIAEAWTASPGGADHICRDGVSRSRNPRRDHFTRWRKNTYTELAERESEQKPCQTVYAKWTSAGGSRSVDRRMSTSTTSTRGR